MVQQKQEVEKAIIGYDQYQLRPQFSYLAVVQEKWFRMTHEQCQQFVRKFHTATIHHMRESTVAANTSSNADIQP